MNDQRFDQLIRTSLEWQAESAASAQPTLRDASRRLAKRLGPQALGPQVTLRPATISWAQLAAMVLLLILLISAVVIVGSELLRRTPPVPPGPFGFASDCGVRLPEGVALEVYADDRPVTIMSDGLVITDLSSPGPPASPETPTGSFANSHVDTILGTVFGQRQLTESGVAQLVERLTTKGVTSGCIALQSEGSLGSITGLTPSGYAALSWSPQRGRFEFARRMSPEEEEEALELLASLSRPETALPAEAWVDSAISRITPDRWVVSLHFIPTDLPPGAVVGLPNGKTLEASDPRYEQVQLPDGQEPLTFGIEYELDDVSHARCGIIATEDALRLARSLDSTFGSESDWFLHTPDMAHELSIGITPAFPPGSDCDTAWAARAVALQPASSSPLGSPASGEFAGEDPCTLLPSVVMLEGRRWTDDQHSERSYLPLGRPARACWLIDTAHPDYDPQDEFFARRLGLTLYPDRVGRDAATDIAEKVLGYESTPTEISGRPVWENHCLASEQPCVPLAAFWHDGRLFFVQFTTNTLGPAVPRDDARAQVTAIIEALD